MYTYTYMYMYMYMCTYTYAYMYMYMYMYLRTYMSMYMYMHTYTCTEMHLDMYMYMNTYVYMYVHKFAIKRVALEPRDDLGLGTNRGLYFYLYRLNQISTYISEHGQVNVHLHELSVSMRMYVHVQMPPHGRRFAIVRPPLAVCHCGPI